MVLGTMHFGTRVPETSALGLLDAARNLGATFWDTANNYAFWSGSGDESESVLGRWFASRGADARDAITLATKVGARPRPGHRDLDHVMGLSAAAVRDQVTDSLRRLGCDHVDLLYAHVDDPEVPIQETLGVFGELVDEGLVREVGASNLGTDRLGEAVSVDAAHPYRALQQRFTFLPARQDADTGPQVVLDGPTQDLASAAGMTLVGYSPLLEGAYTRDDKPLTAEYEDARTADRLDTLREQALLADLDAGQLVLAWMTHRHTPVLPIVGVSREDHLLSAWTAVTTDLSRDVVTVLDDARS